MYWLPSNNETHQNYYLQFKIDMINWDKKMWCIYCYLMYWLPSNNDTHHNYNLQFKIDMINWDEKCNAYIVI